MSDQKSYLEEASELVSGERQEQYGSPLVSLERTAALWSVVLGIDVTPHEVVLCMIQLKVAREVENEKRDNMVDIAGYVGMWDIAERERQATPPSDKPTHPSLLDAYREEAVALDTQ